MSHIMQPKSCVMLCHAFTHFVRDFEGHTNVLFMVKENIVYLIKW